MTLTAVPVEITREVFSHLMIQHSSSNNMLSLRESTCKYISNNKRTHLSMCMCWQLDLLSISMVCKSWNAIAVEIMHLQKESPSWITLLNYASHQRTYPFRSRLVQLMGESTLSKLFFHRTVRHLVIDFASFDTIYREKQKNNTVIKRKVHNSSALSDVTNLLKLCTNANQLDIICDAGFVALLSQHENDHNSIASSITHLQQEISKRKSRIKRLDLIGFNPIQRCPCCAGRDWDIHLIPLLNCLSLDTLVLQHVLPSEQVMLNLAEQPNLKKIVLYRSLITVPESQITKDVNGDRVRFKRRGSNINKDRPRTNSISRIPQKLWNQITSVTIYEDLEDATTWPTRRYLHDLVASVSPQLQEFTLIFGTKEEIEARLIHLDDSHEDDLEIYDTTSALYALKEKCQDSRIITKPLVAL